MAVRCSTVFVEPPKAMSHSMALWMAASVMMSLMQMPLLQKLHDLHAGVLGQAQTLGVHGGDGAVAGKRDAQMPRTGSSWSLR